MHMPGHKRSGDLTGLPYSMDITEIDGFDDLHAMSDGGCIHNIARLAERAYGISPRNNGELSAYPLVGGSTVGILAAVRTAAIQLRKAGDEPRLLMARNCHKSVWHAAELAGLYTRYLCPKADGYGIFDGIDPADVDKQLSDDPNCKITVITSPTYEGVISDIKKIGDAVHRHGGILIVDAAHGAHLPFVTNCKNVFEGADAVVTSLHKTLPALTGCALLLLPSEKMSAAEISRQLNVFETSSPSYILLASIERSISLAASEEDRFTAYIQKLAAARRQLSALTHLSLYEPGGYGHDIYDSGKLVLTVPKGICFGGKELFGGELSNLFRERGIELEMSAQKHVIAMTSAWDMVRQGGDFVSPNIDAFVDAAENIDALLCRKDTVDSNFPSYSLPTTELPIFKAVDSPAVCAEIDSTLGKTSACYVWAYPPGIPLIAPGEVFDKNVIDTLKTYISSGISLHVQPECSSGVWIKK